MTATTISTANAPRVQASHRDRRNPPGEASGVSAVLRPGSETGISNPVRRDCRKCNGADRINVEFRNYVVIHPVNS
jgi:hypothetical protein